MKYSELIKVYRKDVETKGLPASNNHDPSNILFENGRYYLWFTIHYEDKPYNHYDNCCIGCVDSVDGITWEHNRIVFSPSEYGWDNGGVLTANVFRYEGKFYMWYIGVETGYDGVSKRNCSLAVSDSPDGVFKRVSDKPFLSPGPEGSFFEEAVDDVSSVFFRGRWLTYFKGSKKAQDPDDTHIGVALSATPLGPYEFYEGNPIGRGHAFSVWKYKDGLLLLTGLKDKKDEGYIYGNWQDTNGHQYLYFSEDGFHFEPCAEFSNRASGISVDADLNDIKSFWGVSVNTRDRCYGRYIERFDFCLKEE